MPSGNDCLQSQRDGICQQGVQTPWKVPKTRLALKGRNRQIHNMEMSVKSCKNDDITFNIMKNIYIVKFICFMSPFQGSPLWWHSTMGLHPLLINVIPLGFKRFSSHFKLPLVYQFRRPSILKGKDKMPARMLALPVNFPVCQQGCWRSQ
jgi:hypothetical protein